MMRIGMMTALVLGLAGPALGQGATPALPPGLLQALPGGGQPETPQQKREFCQRVAGAVLRCGPGFDMGALTNCLVRTLPPQDSLRVAQLANAARGNAPSVMSDCGIGR